MTRRLLLLAAGLVAALVLGGAWLLGTEAGLHFVLARVLPTLPISVEVRDAEGRLSGPLRVGFLRVDTPAARVTARDVEADWSPLALLAGKVRIVRLHAATLQVQLLDAPESDGRPETGPPGLPAAATPIRVDDLLVRDLSVAGPDRNWLSRGRLGLAGSLSGEGLDLERISLTSSEAELLGHARISREPGQPSSVALQWRIGPDGGTGLAGRTRIDGGPDRFQIEQVLSGVLEGSVSGEVSLAGSESSADLTVQLAPVAAGEGPLPAVLDGLEADLEIAGSPAGSTLAGRFRWPALASGDVAVDASGRWRRGALVLQPLRLAFANGGTARLEGRLAPAEDWAVDADLFGTDLGWPLGDDAPVAPVPELELAVRGDAAEYALQLEGRVGYGEIPVSRLTAVGRLAGTELTVDAAALQNPAADLSVTATGSVEFADGGLAYRFRAGGEAEPKNLPRLSASLSGHGDTGTVQLEALTVHALDGVIDGAGQLAWAPGRSSNFVAELRGLDPSAWAPEFPGRVSARVTLTGAPASGDGLTVELADLRGVLRDKPLSGGGRLKVSGDSVTADPLRLQVGSARLFLRGHAGDELDLSASLAAADLGDILPNAGGQLSLRGSVTGPRRSFRVEATAEGANLRVAGQTLESLRSQAEFYSSGQTRSRLTLDIVGLGNNDGEPLDGNLEVAGLPEDHRIDLSLERGEQRARANLAGGMADAAWSGTLASLELDGQDSPVWRLQAPTVLAVSREAVRLGEACLEGEPGRLCLQGRWARAGGLAADVRLDALRLEPLTEWMGTAYLARGEVSGNVRLEADDDGYRLLTGQFALGEGVLLDRTLGEDPVYTWSGGTVTLDGDRQAARARLLLELGRDERLEGTASVGWNESPQPLSGRIEAEVNFLALLAEFFPDLSNPTGRTSARISLGGTVQRPQLTGSVALEEGSAGVPALGIQLTDVQGTATLDGTNVDVSLSARSGGGLLDMEGWLDLAEGASPVSRFWLSGADVLLVDIPEARLVASPDLKFTYRKAEMRIVGNVSIPSGKLTGIIESGGVNPSPDEVIVGEPPEEGAAVIARIYLQVGPDVDVELGGLSGRLEGEILTVVDPPALPWGRGELRFVDGELAAFGQELEIQRGRLIYTGGPLEEPALDVVARREVDGVAAGARLRGTLSEPSFSIFSEPPMSRAETLSYLTTGKPIGDLSAGEDAALSNAAASLALAGGSMIAGEVGERVGIDTLGFEGSDETGQASLVIGKYLSPQLFVSYGVGLLDAINVLKMRYRLSRKLSVEVATSDETSADIIYTFERD
ncbi:MAG: translocation/assembly module TamB domain-containing protein [Gammaproteobacteria bacterium]